MIYSTSCSNSRVRLTALLVLLTALVLSGPDTTAAAPAQQRLRIAVLPVENESATDARLGEIRDTWIAHLKELGIEVLDPDTIEQFLAKHRIRYTGGLDSDSSEAFRNEIGVDAVLITVVELYIPSGPPRIALLSRLVETGKKPNMLWFESVGLTGDDHPGILGIGRIGDTDKLREKAIGSLSESLAAYLAGKDGSLTRSARFSPKSMFRSPLIGKSLQECFVSFVLSNSSVEEDGGQVRLTVLLSSPSARRVSVDYSAIGGTAVKDRDYAVNGKRLTFAPGETVKTVTIDIRNSGMYGDNKTIEVGLRRPRNALLGSIAHHTCTIINTHPLPTVGFTASGQSVKETGQAASIVVALSSLSAKDVTVPFTVSGTARTPSNFTITPSPAVIKAGERAASIVLTPADNGINEDQKTAVVRLGMPKQALQGEKLTHTVTIVDTDPEPAVAFVAPVSRSEDGAGRAPIELGLSRASGKTVTVSYEAAGGTAIRGRDYALSGATVTFLPGETRKEIDIELKNSGINNDDKTIEMALVRADRARLGDTVHHTCTITNTAPLPQVGFARAVSDGDEKISPARVEVVLSRPSGKRVSVAYAVTGGSASEGKDYTVAGKTITFEPGETVKAVEIEIKKNPRYKDNKTIEIALSSPANSVLGTAAHTYTIINTAPMPIAAFTAASQRVKENRGPASITVELSAVSEKEVIIPFTVTGTAKTPGNYTITPGPVVIKAGERSASITVQVADNGVNEDEKTIDVSMGQPVNAAQGKSVQTRVTIIDTDPEPAVAFSSTGQAIKENGGAATVTLELSTVSGKDVSVPFTVTGTAKTPGNYAITPGPVVIKAGERSASIAVQVADNGINEDEKTVILSMGVPTHAIPGKNTAHTVTILDTDPEPAVFFAKRASRGSDKSGKALFDIALSQISGKTVTVEYVTTGGSAIPGRDYTLLGKTITFSPGETRKTIEVAIKNNGVYDDNKTIELALLKAEHAVLGEAQVHRYTIVNTTPPPLVTFVQDSQRIRTSAKTATIIVDLSAVSGKDVVVPFSVANSTNNPVPFTVTANPVTIKAGKRSAAITVTLADREQSPDRETIDFTLSSPQNAALGRMTSHKLTVVHRDSQPTIAVVPFINISNKKAAGDILMFQFVKELMKLTDFSVIEPGVVRQQLLSMRIIMYDGVSEPDTELLIKTLDADLILTGKVFDYQDPLSMEGSPKADFSVMLIDKTRGKVIWASKSYNEGDDAMLLFDWGKSTTASAMVAEMVRAVRTTMVKW